MHVIKRDGPPPKNRQTIVGNSTAFFWHARFRLQAIRSLV